MTLRNSRSFARAFLLAGTCLAASPAAAQSVSMEERIARLERLVEGLVSRMDAQQGAIDQSQAQALAQVQQSLAETRAVQQQQTALAAKVDEAGKAQDKGFRVGKTSVTYSGYMKLDTIMQRTSGGQFASGSNFRDFLVPGVIPVGGAASGWDQDFNARQSRIVFKTSTDVGTGTPVNTHLELDFMATDGGDERITNAHVPGVRQAFFTYGNVLMGQTWSTFQDVGALPDTLDFVGPTPGTVFSRQPMIRYTKGGLQLAAEQPETTITSRTGARVLSGDDNLPDMVARYNLTGTWGAVSAAGILRSLRVRNDDFGTGDDSALGYGASFAGKVNIGKTSDFRFMATAGEGLGRYIGLNIVNDAAIDLAGNLDPIGTLSGFAAFRHSWSGTLRSTVSGAYFKADNPVVLTGNQVTDESWNALANLIWSPVKPLDIGIEYMYAERTLENGRSGNLQKVQVSSKFTF